MASFQVEIATTSPFGRDSSCFHNDLNNLVSTSCIPNDHHNHMSNNNDSPSSSPPPPHIDFTDLWVHHPQWQTTTATTIKNNNNNNNKINNHKKKQKEDQGRDRDPDRQLSNIDETASSHMPSRDSKWERAREIVFSAKGSSCDSSPSNARGVSSLVKKWRDFEAEANCSGKNNSSSSSSAATTTTTTTCQDAPAAVTCCNNEDDLFGDWESDRTVMSGPPSSRGRESDATEKEKLRVADIIRKLTEDIRRSASAADVGPDSAAPTHARISLDHQSEQRCFSPQIGSPRMRGRQAYHHLLMRMERDRRKELEGLMGRQAVSKFSHRGHIQALLRIRFMRRGIEANGGRHSNCASSESHKAMQSAITHFRERVDPSAVNGSVHTRSWHKELADETRSATDLYATKQHGKENKYHQVRNSKGHIRMGDQVLDSKGCITSREHNVEHNTHKFAESMEQKNGGTQTHDASSLSIVMSQGTSWEDGNHSFIGYAGIAKTLHGKDTNSLDTMESLCSIKINAHNQEREVSDEQVVKNSYDLMNNSVDQPPNYQERESVSNQDLVETSTYWVSDVSHPKGGWEELHSDYQLQEISNRDWMDEVSRPRSDWEHLRQARYQEMLDPFSDNEDIRMLLGRRSVSTFLSSGLREKIDRLMILRAQGHETLKGNHTQVEKLKKLFPEGEQAMETEEGENDRRVDRQDEEENYGGYFDEYEEAESSIGNLYNESDNYIDYIISSPPVSWTQNQGRESSDCSYHAPSPCTQQSSSNFCSHNNGSNSSCGAHPAIDMELIYDLRKHMEQLHQEMSELRRSIKCCMDMQFRLQRSIKKEVAIALNHPDAKINGRRNSIKKFQGEDRCCVCSKVQVDSLLYRCGHICTCYECAHELQLSSQKCPICAAPILDVIRTYSNPS